MLGCTASFSNETWSKNDRACHSSGIGCSVFCINRFKWDATVTVIDKNIPVEQVESYLNPLPHTLMLTAIVVGVATLGVAFTLLIAIYNRYGTLDEQELLEEIQ